MTNSLAIPPISFLTLPQKPPTNIGRYVALHLGLVPALLSALALACEYGPIDVDIARFFFDPGTASFPWRHSTFFEVVGHHAARSLPIFLGTLSLVAGLVGLKSEILRPWSATLLAVALAVASGPLVVNGLKAVTAQHCPVAMEEFGGSINYDRERSSSFWAASPQSAGRCQPSSHAAGGYALLTLYFAGWLIGHRRLRWMGLAIGAGAGLLFSLVRIMQGAHFASATIWSADIDWIVCSLIFLPLICGRRRREGDREG